ncbi:MAG: class I SAM-dependent methyltransferase [Phycisphaerae bacterium]|nr:class I SAM-dependent methyltransferase [Phycisphaerae bacterium]
MDESLYLEMAALENRYWWFVAKRRILLTLIRRFLEAPIDRARVCDIGCGSGGLLRDLSHAGASVLGTDSSPLARDLAARDGLRIVDASLPDGLPDGPFDALVMSDVLEHVEHDAASVAAAAERLAPGGIMVCTVPAHPWMWTERDAHHGHYRRYRRADYARLFAIPTLEPVRVSYYNAALFPVMAAARLGKKWLGRDRASGTHGGDIRELPAAINAILRETFAFERHLLTRVSIPFGASLVSVHRRIV